MAVPGLGSLARSAAATFWVPARRRAPVAKLRGVLGEGGVPYVVHGLDLPVGADHARELGGSGLLGAQAGDRIDGLDADLIAFAVQAASLELGGLAGAGEEQAVHGAHLDAADLATAMTALSRAVL